MQPPRTAPSFLTPTTFRSSTQLAALLGITLGVSPLPARAWDPWPCEVALCMSNPSGPEAEPTCVPPIQRLWREMRRPRFRMPVCEGLAQDDITRAINDVRREVEGSLEQTMQRFGEQLTNMQGTGAVSGTSTALGYGATDPCPNGMEQRISYGGDEGSQSITAVCLGNLVARTIDRRGSSCEVYTGFRQPTWSTSSVYIDVYVNGALWQRVRPGAGHDGQAVTIQYASSPSAITPPSVMPTSLALDPDALPDRAVAICTDPLAGGGG